MTTERLMTTELQRIRVVDSHTGGEPTRVIINGGPDLGTGTMAERLKRLRDQFDHVRSATVNEPRGSDPVVGALLLAPQHPGNTAGVIFFNNVGYLGMCGHGTIGLMATLAHLGRIQPGTHRIETPVGTIEAELLDAHQVSLRNVESWRYGKDVRVEVEGYGVMHGDIAWGGNWFFLVNDHGQQLTSDNIPRLMDCSMKIREGLERAGISAGDGAVIDHIELIGPSATADARNFVLCPGLAYDRSPCGTGTSAKLACLHADGKLAPGQIWIQESVIGSRFEARLEWHEDRLYPRITGTAYVNAEAELLLNPADPFIWGIRHLGHPGLT